MPDKPKKPADQLTNEELASRLFPPQVIEKVKAEEREKESKSAPPKPQK